MKHEATEARLFGLIEQKTFEKLTAEEARFVLQHMSREEFDFRHSLIGTAENLVFPDADPLPLSIRKPGIAWYKRPVPLYQAVSGIAATLLLIWSLNNSNNAPAAGLTNKASDFPLTSTQIMYDTVIREVTQIQTAIRYVHDTVRLVQYEFCVNDPHRPIKAAREFSPLDITEQIVQNRPLSMKEDKTAALLTQIAETDRVTAH